MPNASFQKNASIGCAFLFLLPFVVVGLGGLGFGIYNLATTGEFTEDTLAPLGVGTMFTLVGGGMMLALFYGLHKEKELERFKAQDPDAPWRWRKDWATGRVNSATPATLFVYWLFGIVFSAVSFPVFLNLDEIMRKAPEGYLAFLLPLVGIGMLAAALYATMRHVKYGQVWCDLVSNPGVLGGWFRAVIWAKVKLAPGESIETQLTCYHCYTTGSGKNRSSHRKVKWQENLTLSQEYLAVEPDGTVAIPVRYYIPRSCTPTTPGSPTDRREWELKATAKVAGIDFLTQFIVPVFLTEESTDIPPEDVIHEEETKVAAPYRPTIVILEGVDSLEFYAPPRRNWGMAFGLTFFTAIWTTVVVVMIYAGDTPVFFPIVFGLFDILLLFAVVWLWFGHARVRLEHGAAKISRTVFGMGPRSTVDFASVTGVDAHINMQSGSTPYYVIRLLTGSGSKNTVGGIANKDEAKDLVRRLEAFILNTAD